ncbi:MAG: GTPase Era [Myxococcota bacterium]|jgi:GTP-binding protein Era|nr:GTPase Era [Myxococcota bacterium]
MNLDKNKLKKKITRCGYVAVIGRPNVGKSTLLNSILGEKVSIVTPKPQTTRNRIRAIHNLKHSQIIFLDTPGIHKAQGKLGEFMNDEALAAIGDADVCLFMIDLCEKGRREGLTSEERRIAQTCGESGRPVIAVVNKVDAVADKSKMLPLLSELGHLPGIVEIIPISARSKDGVELLLQQLAHRLPEAPWLFPEDMLSDQAERFFVAEMVREALTELTREEVPYQSAVVIERFIESEQSCLVEATIFVEKESQKGIVLGKGGAMIKAIGIKARKSAERFLGVSVVLKLHVSVSEGWSKSEGGLRQMGYEK